MDEIERLTREVAELREQLAEMKRGWTVLAERFGAPQPYATEAR